MADDLVIVAHRGPVQHVRAANGYRMKRNAGGLVTALRDLVRNVDGTRWICAAASDADREAAADDEWMDVPLGDASCRMRMLSLDRAAHRDFYAVVSNPILWFVQHGLWDYATAPEIGRREQDAWQHGYVAVNRAFADAVCDSRNVPEGSFVMVHDYHFYVLPQLVRSRRPDLFLHSFVHIPWPQPGTWRMLPARWRDAIFRGLLGSDIVAFHTERYERNFLQGCRELCGLDVDFRHSSVRIGSREVAVRHYPISVDEETLRNLAAAPETQRLGREIDAIRAEHLVVRVDRTDPSKNIVRGFHAFDRMLECHPELYGRVTFLALLQPSRLNVPEYARYLAEIERSAAAVNQRHGYEGWAPVDLRLGDDMALALAAYQRFDVLMVNAVADGMNLVVKEAIVVNDRDGVVALSENAGAYDELGSVAVTLHPFDVDQQADALYRALTMPADDRRERHRMGVEIVRSNDVRRWLERQLWDIELVQGLRGTRAARAAVP